MNNMISTCPEPIQKYRELQEVFEQFQQEWEKISETGKMPEGLEDLKKEIEKRRQEFDRLLEKCFSVFEFEKGSLIRLESSTPLTTTIL